MFDVGASSLLVGFLDASGGK